MCKPCGLSVPRGEALFLSPFPSQAMGNPCHYPLTYYNTFLGLYEGSHEVPSLHTQGEMRSPNGNRPSLLPPLYQLWLGHSDSRDGRYNHSRSEGRVSDLPSFFPRKGPPSQGRETHQDQHPKFSTLFCLRLSPTGLQQWFPKCRPRTPGGP